VSRSTANNQGRHLAYAYADPNAKAVAGRQTALLPPPGDVRVRGLFRIGSDARWRWSQSATSSMAPPISDKRQGRP